MENALGAIIKKSILNKSFAANFSKNNKISTKWPITNSNWSQIKNKFKFKSVVSSKIFHKQSCFYLKNRQKTKIKNKSEFIVMDYKPCKKCNP